MAASFSCTAHHCPKLKHLHEAFLPSSTAQHWAEDAALMHWASHHQNLPTRRHRRADMHLNHAFTASTSTNNAVIRSLLIRSMMLFLADLIRLLACATALNLIRPNGHLRASPVVSGIHRAWMIQRSRAFTAAGRRVCSGRPHANRRRCGCVQRLPRLMEME